MEGDFFEAVNDRQDQLHLEYELTRQTKMDSKGRLHTHQFTNQDSSVREVHPHGDNQRKVAVYLSNSPQELFDKARDSISRDIRPVCRSRRRSQCDRHPIRAVAGDTGRAHTSLPHLRPISHPERHISSIGNSASWRTRHFFAI